MDEQLDNFQDKEVVKKRLEEEEKEFLNRKRQRERELIEMEKQVRTSSP